MQQESDSTVSQLALMAVIARLPDIQSSDISCCTVKLAGRLYLAHLLKTLMGPPYRQLVLVLVPCPE